MPRKLWSFKTGGLYDSLSHDSGLSRQVSRYNIPEHAKSLCCQFLSPHTCVAVILPSQSTVCIKLIDDLKDERLHVIVAHKLPLGTNYDNSCFSCTCTWITKIYWKFVEVDKTVYIYMYSGTSELRPPLSLLNSGLNGRFL